MAATIDLVIGALICPFGGMLLFRRLAPRSAEHV